MAHQREDFGTELRRRRMAAGISLRDLAARIHYSPGYLSNVETARKHPSEDLARRCDAALDAGGALRALAADQPPTGVAADRPGEMWPGEMWMVGLDNEGSSWFAPIARRDLFAAAGVTAMSGFIIEPPAPVRTAGALETMSTLRTWFDQARSLGQRVSPGFLLPMLIAGTHAAKNLSATVPSATRADALILAARFAEYTGWMVQESGDNRAAIWWTTHAAELAQAAGDPSMSAYALVRRALVTLYLDDPVQTIELARRAQSDAAGLPRVHGLAALREAQAHAMAGDHDACRRALDHARETLARDDPHAEQPVLGTSNVVDPVTMATGWCMYDLGRTGEAAAILDRELERVPADAVRAGLRWGARRALAYAAQGEVEHTVALCREMLPAIGEVASATIRYDLLRLQRTLTHWVNRPAVRELLPDLNLALRTPPMGWTT
jgi:transcriptional regulator with XRE-family HTH domain